MEARRGGSWRGSGGGRERMDGKEGGGRREGDVEGREVGVGRGGCALTFIYLKKIAAQEYCKKLQENHNDAHYDFLVISCKILGAFDCESRQQASHKSSYDFIAISCKNLAIFWSRTLQDLVSRES